MNVPPAIFDVALRRGSLGLALRIVIVMMVCLGTLAAATSLGLSRTVHAEVAPLKGRLTIEVPATNGDTASPTELMPKMIAALGTSSDIVSQTPVPAEDVARLLKPWIDDPAAWPLPTLIDVQLRPGADPDAVAAALKPALAAIAPGITIDSHEAWSAGRLDMLGLLGGFADLAALFAGITLAIMVALIARIALLTQRETLSILHLMGATETGIARRFQHSVVALTWPAALIGAALAVAPLGFLAKTMMALDGNADPHAPWMDASFVVIAAPLLTILIAAVAARLAARAWAAEAS